MPIVHVNIAAGRSREMKDEMARLVTQAIATALKADLATIRVLIHEIETEDWYSGGTHLVASVSIPPK